MFKLQGDLVLWLSEHSRFSPRKRVMTLKCLRSPNTTPLLSKTGALTADSPPPLSYVASLLRTDYMGHHQVRRR
jgi:hypothetical protein